MGRKNQNKELGRSLANAKDRKRQAKREDLAGARHTVGDSSRPQLVSVLESNDLEELMSNATLANATFEAERYAGPVAPPRAVVVTPLASNSALAREHDAKALRIPRRPEWDENTSPRQLQEEEMRSFLVWRRTIAAIEEDVTANAYGTLTPFEKNINVWRQLWRVAERADNVVQIVDARNPLLYYCEDLVRWVTQELGRKHTLVINKADLLSSEMVGRWETYFKEKGVDVIFFSAFKASIGEDNSDTRVIGAAELIERLSQSPRTAPVVRDGQRIVVGMCGYPNVGKSSTINVLLDTAAGVNGEEAEGEGEGEGEQVAENASGADDLQSTASDLRSTVSDADGAGVASKRVAVSATPGRTKHFQTLILTDELILCDCPGLVFPNFTAGKAELICAGVLSIDQMRADSLAPIRLIARRIPSAIFEGVYGIRFPTQTATLLEDAPKVPQGYVDAETLLDTHARARGFMTAGHGLPDRSRSSRVVLRDYVSGRIRFAHPPPPAPEKLGEAGVGPDVFAKKGRLVIARREAAQVQAAKAAVDASVVDAVEQKAPPVVARLSSRKKHAHKEFTRVERQYTP